MNINLYEICQISRLLTDRKWNSCINMQLPFCIQVSHQWSSVVINCFISCHQFSSIVSSSSSVFINYVISVHHLSSVASSVFITCHPLCHQCSSVFINCFISCHQFSSIVSSGCSSGRCRRDHVFI